MRGVTVVLDDEEIARDIARVAFLEFGTPSHTTHPRNETVVPLKRNQGRNERSDNRPLSRVPGDFSTTLRTFQGEASSAREDSSTNFGRLVNGRIVRGREIGDINEYSARSLQ